MREAEQQHRACQVKVEALKSRALEANEELERARQLLWAAEVKARQAEEELREAV